MIDFSGVGIAALLLALLPLTQTCFRGIDSDAAQLTVSAETRAIKAAQAAGLTVCRIEIVNGNPTIIFGDKGRQNDDANAWDKAMAELEGQQ